MRKEVQDFANDMERVLKENDYKHGWKNDHVIDLYDRVEDEVKELQAELFVCGKLDWCKIQKEAVDVANFAMMIWDLARAKEDKHKGIERRNGIIYKKGDVLEGGLIDPTKRGKIVCHVVNNKGKWGRGFVVNLSKKWKEPEEKYRARMGSLHLGGIHMIQVDKDKEKETYVANMIAQDGFVGPERPVAVDYDSLYDCLYLVGREAIDKQLEVHTIRIGCGLGGGSWDVVEEIIQRTLVDYGITVAVYDL